MLVIRSRVGIIFIDHGGFTSTCVSMRSEYSEIPKTVLLLYLVDFKMTFDVCGMFLVC